MAAKPGESSPKTKTYDGDFAAGRRLRGEIYCGGDVEERLVDADLLDELHAAVGVGGIVVELDAGLHAVEKSGGQGVETFAGVEVDDRADVAIDAEDFLDDDDGGSGGVRRRGFGEIGCRRWPSEAVSWTWEPMGERNSTLKRSLGKKNRGLGAPPSAQREHP